ncbi:hypothetical protein DVH24_001417 [Malus domestica]|uniref:Uncharacterized protein n=1 Tax=Malus domestica TaxID=3750 RepID=A0A498K665_MALDO|nr:hypothetical protein DVH24_001417 [Malus domestica]
METAVSMYDPCSEKEIGMFNFNLFRFASPSTPNIHPSAVRHRNPLLLLQKLHFCFCFIVTDVLLLTLIYHKDVYMPLNKQPRLVYADDDCADDRDLAGKGGQASKEIRYRSVVLQSMTLATRKIFHSGQDGKCL